MIAAAYFHVRTQAIRYKEVELMAFARFISAFSLST